MPRPSCRAPIAAFAVIFALAALAAACGGGAPAAPDAPPSAIPTPEPAPTPVYGCGLPRGTGIGRNCPRLRASYAAELEAAIEKVIEEHPWFFDFRRARGGPTSYRVRNPAGYNREVVENLRRAGFCALDDGQEIGIKTTNDFSDHYQILSSDLFVIRGLPSNRSTCFPAWDAIP